MADTIEENKIDAEIARDLYRALNAQNVNIVNMILGTMDKNLASRVRTRAAIYKDK